MLRLYGKHRDSLQSLMWKHFIPRGCFSPLLQPAGPSSSLVIFHSKMRSINYSKHHNSILHVMTRALLRCNLKLFIGMLNENERIIKTLRRKWEKWKQHRRSARCDLFWTVRNKKSFLVKLLKQPKNSKPFQTHYMSSYNHLSFEDKDLILAF